MFLYPTVEGGGAVAVNHKEPGEHFITKVVEVEDEKKAASAAAPAPRLPPLSALPLYDLHMRRVWGSPAGLLYREAALEGVGREGLCRWVGET